MLSFIVLLAAVHARDLPVFLFAEEGKSKEKGKKEMKASVYEKLQDWQLMAIVKAAPDYIEKVEGKLKKVMDKCKRRRNPGLPIGPPPNAPAIPLFPGNELAGPVNPGGATSWFAAEGEENKEKMDGGKKDKKKNKVDKMKPEELVKKAISIDDKLKKMEKKIKKYSKNC